LCLDNTLQIIKVIQFRNECSFQTGENDFESVTHWIYEQFMSKCKNPDKKIAFVLNANRTEEAKLLFSQLIDITKDSLFNTRTYEGYGILHNLFDKTVYYTGVLSWRQKYLIQILNTGYFHDTLFVYK
jgi:hypothetical protein